MNIEELIGKLQMVYVGDKNALNELIGYYDGLKDVIKILQQENARLKDKIDKAVEYIKNIDKYEETLNDDTRVYMIQDVDVDEIERILKEN